MKLCEREEGFVDVCMGGRGEGEREGEFVRKKVLKEGTGMSLKAGMLVKVDFDMWDREEALCCIDSTRQREKPLVTRIGDETLVKGLNVALVGMRCGEVAEYEFSPGYGYGEYGCPPKIPARCVLRVELEVLEACDDCNYDLLTTVLEKNPGAVNNMPFGEFLEVVQSVVEVGRFWLGEGRCVEAQRSFETVSDACLEYSACENEEEVEHLERIFCAAYGGYGDCFAGKNFSDAVRHYLRALSVYPDENVRLSLCREYLCIKDFKRCLREATKVLRRNPSNEKAREMLERASRLNENVIGIDSHSKFGISSESDSI
eukprot:Nk52_evm14s2579 gene=Nk52_evmTU14s2579